MAHTCIADRSDSPTTTVYRTPRADRSEVRAAMTRRDGGWYASMRVFYPDRARTTWYPSANNGITLPAARLSELRDAVNALERAASLTASEEG